MRRILFILSAIFSLFLSDAQAQERPKIGLTLSGGGAKGLAHIGVLKAIDEAGLKIDYITGTSMGAIVGALYAAGYSADSIEQIAMTNDWSVLLSNYTAMESVMSQEKAEFGKYLIELPLKGIQPQLPSGLIEGQELWNKFYELFYPVYDIKNFNKFPIPFHCMATDLATGGSVVLDSGEIVTALRATMSIPSVFTPIYYEHGKLVDGGLSVNFPIREAKKMGATFVIGSNVANGLLPADELVTALDVLYQATFFKEAEDFKKERQQCNVYITHDMAGYSAASFNSATDIVKKGVEEGKQYVAYFRKLADSLNAHYTDSNMVKNRMRVNKPMIIDHIQIDGLKHTEQSFLLKKTYLHEGDSVSPKVMTSKIRNAYGTRFYTNLNYIITPLDSNGHVKITFKVKEQPMAFVKAAVNFNSFLSASLVINGTYRNFIFNKSRSLATFSISTNPKALLQMDKYLGKKLNSTIRLEGYFESTRYKIYSNNKAGALYRRVFTTTDLSYIHSPTNSVSYGIGETFNYFWISPEISETFEVKANNSFFTSYIFFKINTLNRRYFTTKGMELILNGGVNYMQNLNTKFNFEAIDTTIVPNTSEDNYYKTSLKFRSFMPISSKTTIITNINAAFILNSNDQYLNGFIVGGMYDFNYNQMPFVGLHEGQFSAGNIATVIGGVQYEIIPNIFITGKFNVGVWDLNIDYIDKTNLSDVYDGYSLGVAYNSRLGPLELSIQRNDNTNTTFGYVNLGFNF